MTVLIQSSHLSTFALSQKHIFRNMECPHASNGQTHFWKRSEYGQERQRALSNAVTSCYRHFETKPVNTILMNLQPIQFARAPTEHLTFGAMLDELRKIKEEKLRKEEEKQK